jgi:hypothetical protein
MILPVRPDVSIALTQERIETQHILETSMLQGTENILGLATVGGSFSGIVPCKGSFGYLLKHLCGKVTTTGPAGAKYTHVYNFYDKVFPGLSIAVNKGAASYVYDGCQIKSMKFDLKPGAGLTYTCAVTGRSQRTYAAITSPSLSILSADAYWICKSVIVYIDGVATSMTGVEIEYTRALEEGEDKSYNLSTLYRASLPSNGMAATVNFHRVHSKDGDASASKFHDKWRADSVVSIEITFAHPTDADYSVTIHLYLKVVKADPVHDNVGLLMETAECVAVNMDLAQTLITITDEASTPTSATGAYSG